MRREETNTFLDQSRHSACIAEILLLARMMERPDPLSAALVTLTGAGIFLLLRSWYGTGLNCFPGPFWASMTYLWRLRDAYVNFDKRPSFVKLHEKYGEVVRLGRKTLSYSSPHALKEIYGNFENMEKLGSKRLRKYEITDKIILVQMVLGFRSPWEGREKRESIPHPEHPLAC